MYITGFRKSDIADWLNSNGYKTSYGNQFTLTAITPLIKNTRYIGKYYYADNEYTDETQRIVTDDIFYKAQQKPLQTNTEEVVRLSSVIYCQISCIADIVIIK